MTNLTERLAEHAACLSFEALPEKAVFVQKRSFADALACMVAGTGYSKESGAFVRYALSQSSGGKCTLIGSEKRTLPGLAALSNGALSHVLDFEDSHEKALVHPNSVAIPALMALSQEVGGVSGRRFITAMITASDICCRLDLGIKEDLLKYGWNMPPVHGGVGAVMGAGNLLGLDKGQIQDALAIQMTSMSSSAQAAISRDSVIRAVRDGFAAQAAVQAALLAREGIAARFDDALEGKLGYFHAYARDNYDPEVITDALGERYESMNISFKPWPCCRATHAALECVRNLKNEHGIDPENIESIHLVMHEIARMVFEPPEVKYSPALAEMAKLSMPFVIGAMLTYGAVELESFSEERLHDSKVLACARKVTFEVDEALTKEQNKKTAVTVTMKDGTRYFAENELPLGCVENPLSDAELFAKFKNCMSSGVKAYSQARIQQVFDMIMSLESLEDIGSLLSLL